MAAQGEHCHDQELGDCGCNNWFEELKHPENFYSDAVSYWKSIPSTVDGMLGGFGHLSSTDVAASADFISPLISTLCRSAGRALDCGAGIGRISKMLLLPLFSEVDLLEQNPAFLEKAKTYLGASASRVGNYFAMGMQDFSPKENHYDLMWLQWVTGHLTDDDLVSFLQRCIKGLNPSSGLIVIKENISSSKDTFDARDSSVIRCLQSLLAILQRARLKIIKEEVQADFQPPLYTVKMFALQPNKI